MSNIVKSHIERTFVMVKPEGVRRNLIGALIQRFENRDEFGIIAIKLVRPTRALADAHYHMHRNQRFYNDLVDLMTSGPVIAMVWEGEHAIKVCRMMTGSTNPLEAVPGTIRGDYAGSALNSLIHVSDSPETAEEEIALWFPEGVG
jgi:nucleoside-diphosphate kinase